MKRTFLHSTILEVAKQSGVTIADPAIVKHIESEVQGKLHEIIKDKLTPKNLGSLYCKVLEEQQTKGSNEPPKHQKGKAQGASEPPKS